MAWYLTGLYRTKELAFRLAIFWSANSIAGMVSGVLALGLLSAGSGSHLDGWQVLFLTEGGGTILVAILGGLLLPASVFDSDRPGRSLVGRVVFSERDAAVLAAALTHEDPRMLTRATQRATPKDIRDTLLDWRIYVHVISAFLSSVMFTPFNTYGPSLVKSLGYKGYTAVSFFGKQVGVIQTHSTCRTAWLPQAVPWPSSFRSSLHTSPTARGSEPCSLR